MASTQAAAYSFSRSEGSPVMPSMHSHNSYELYYLEAGSREYFVDDVLFSVSAGEFVLIAPGKLHRTGGEYGMRTLVGFTEEFMLRFFSRDALGQLLACFEKLRIAPPDPLNIRCRQLLQVLYEAEEELDFALTLGELLRLLSKCETTQISGDPVSAIVTYINQNFGSIHHISQIADQFYISRFHLCRVFKEAMKMTVVDYLNRVRIKNACQYLRASDKDMGEICLLCGFHDPAYFSNVFKKITGITPSQYRKNGE